MVNLVFTGIAASDPEFHITQDGNTVVSVLIDVKQEPHVPPTRVFVVATGKPAVYARATLKRESPVMVSGWFTVRQNKKGNEFIEVKARNLRVLVV